MGTQGLSLVIATLLIGMSTKTAWAYLDPGTGSMILQVLLGGVAGLLLAGKLYWHRILTVLGLRREPVGTDAATGEQGIKADASLRK
jgi:hypothetical protein